MRDERALFEEWAEGYRKRHNLTHLIGAWDAWQASSSFKGEHVSADQFIDTSKVIDEDGKGGKSSQGSATDQLNADIRSVISGEKSIVVRRSQE